MADKLGVGGCGVYVGVVFGEHVAFGVDVVGNDIAKRHF